jgi:hypothetical protein
VIETTPEVSRDRLHGVHLRRRPRAVRCEPFRDEYAKQGGANTERCDDLGRDPQAAQGLPRPGRDLVSFLSLHVLDDDAALGMEQSAQFCHLVIGQVRREVIRRARPGIVTDRRTDLVVLDQAQGHPVGTDGLLQRLPCFSQDVLFHQGFADTQSGLPCRGPQPVALCLPGTQPVRLIRLRVDRVGDLPHFR